MLLQYVKNGFICSSHLIIVFIRKALCNKDKINLAFSRSFEKHVCQVLYLLKERQTFEIKKDFYFVALIIFLFINHKL